jgi:hypothetical protein
MDIEALQIQVADCIWLGGFNPSSKYLFEGSLEVKLPTIWTDEKQSRAEAGERR